MKKLYHTDGIYVLKKEQDKLRKQTKKDLEFCLSIAEQLFNGNLPKGLSPEFYKTLSYEKDLQICNHLAEIRKRLKK